ncbi:MAG: 4Fe-4S binding protein [Labilithrix sp.]
MTLGATHQIYRGLLWSVGLLAVTLVFGRVFCGWICPFGTLHHFFGFGSCRRRRGAARRASRRTRRTATSARSTT